MGRLRQAMDRPLEAERYHLEALERGRRVLPEGDWILGRTLYAYGDTLIALERYAEAEKVLLESHGNLETALGAEHVWTRAAASRLEVLYETWK